MLNASTAKSPGHCRQPAGAVLNLKINYSKTFTMIMSKSILLLFLGVFICSCNSSSSNTSDITNNYNLITTAIRTSKESRLKFQDKFATALDSFLLNDYPLVTIEEQKRLLEEATVENKKAENLILAANEIDSTLRYKEKALDLFRFLDTQYNSIYPEIFKIMESSAKNKKALITKLIVPSSDSLKAKSTEVIETAKSIIKKYDIKLVEVEN